MHFRKVKVMSWFKDFLVGFGIGGLILGYIGALMLIILFPLVTIWGLNTLFGLGVAYTFKTWLSMLVVGVFIRGGNIQTNKE